MQTDKIYKSIDVVDSNEADANKKQIQWMITTGFAFVFIQECFENLLIPPSFRPLP